MHRQLAADRFPPGTGPRSWRGRRVSLKYRRPRKATGSGTKKRRLVVSPSATHATLKEGGCHQVPGLPREAQVDIAKCHASLLDAYFLPLFFPLSLLWIGFLLALLFWCLFVFRFSLAPQVPRLSWKREIDVHEVPSLPGKVAATNDQPDSPWAQKSQIWSFKKIHQKNT